MPKKVMVAMSGGVDSSAAAFLLKEQGYDVSGATLKLFSNEDMGETDKTRTCCSLDDIYDARAVADKLSLTHHVFNFGASFNEEVMERFAKGYISGETPNPCIDCNRYIKFNMLLKRAVLLENDFIATGHYVRVEFDERKGRYLLKKATDASKDQSYVLYTMTQKELSKTLFPLGGLLKSDVRKIAMSQGLINAKKPDSQDICFVKDGDYAGFIERAFGFVSVPGNFVDTDGNVIGRHKGVIHYTIGQRKGLGIGFGSRKYVIKKDNKTNTVILGDEDLLFGDSLVCKQVNLISIEKLEHPINVTAKIRYSHKETPAVLHPIEDGISVKFEKPQRAITPGQAVVFYDGDTVVGGGTIVG